MADPASIPWGTVKVRHERVGQRDSGCVVHVDGQPVANLPAIGAKWEYEGGKQRTAYITLTFLAEDVDIESFAPGQRRKDPEEELPSG